MAENNGAEIKERLDRRVGDLVSAIGSLISTMQSRQGNGTT